MSHQIVRGIKFKKDVQEVWIKSTSNNVTPKTYHWEENKWLSGIWKKDGLELVERFILRDYWDGMAQPGNLNNFYRASEMCYHLHPDMSCGNTGRVKNAHLLDCPLEDLPKNLNIDDRVGQEIVRLRLAGETIDPKMRGIIKYTDQEVSDALYDIYKGWRSNVKGKFYKKYNTGYLLKATTRHIQYQYRIEDAKCFNSEEDAIIYCRRHHLSTDNIFMGE